MSDRERLTDGGNDDFRQARERINAVLQRNQDLGGEQRDVHGMRGTLEHQFLDIMHDFEHQDVRPDRLFVTIGHDDSRIVLCREPYIDDHLSLDGPPVQIGPIQIDSLVLDFSALHKQPDQGMLGIKIPYTVGYIGVCRYGCLLFEYPWSEDTTWIGRLMSDIRAGHVASSFSAYAYVHDNQSLMTAMLRGDGSNIPMEQHNKRYMPNFILWWMYRYCQDHVDKNGRLKGMSARIYKKDNSVWLERSRSTEEVHITNHYTRI